MASTSKMTLLIDLSKKLFDSKIGQMQRKFGQTVKKMKVDFKEFADEIPALGRGMDLLSNKWLLMGAVTAGLVAGLGKATAMANDWHKQMAEINVTAELSKGELKELSDNLLDIGTKNVAPLEEVPKAFSRIISAGLDVNQSMAALEPTLRAAKAGFTDIETVASAEIATMMSSGENINKVYDILFATVKEGNAEFKDIANYMPKLTPLAKGLGYELDQTAGAFASLTTKLSAEQSTTALQGIIRSLSDERIALGQVGKGGIFKTGFKSLGIDVHDAAGKIKPLTEIVGLLNEKMKGLTDKQRMEQFSKLGLDQMSTMGFQTLMQDMEGLQKATNATSNAQGTLSKAYTDSLTPLEQWGIAQNNLKATMIKIGEAILPMLAKAIKFITPVLEWIYRNVDWLIPVFGTFAGVLGVVTAATWAWNAALYANPVGLIIAAIAAMIALIVVAVKKFDEWGAAILYLMGPIGWLVIVIKTLWKHWDSIKKAFTDGGIVEGLKRIGAVILDMLLYPIQQLLQLLSNIPGLGKLAGKGADFIKGMRDALGVSDNDKKDEEDTPEDNPLNPTINPLGTPTENLFGNNGNKQLGDQVGKVTGDASQVKNITINIGTMAQNTFEKGTTNGLTWQQVEERMNDILLRVVRNAELS
ncbi:phage tail tape measure protein [Capnocytophaga canimorsus]|uniref:phage tail tape measure protein n=1 Tax=Capnocytophaga canimorsus TaxID=28188 RepID=UPI00385E6130